MDALVQAWPQNTFVSATADSFFANLNWLHAHPDIPTTFEVAMNDFPFYNLFTHNLRHH